MEAMNRSYPPAVILNGASLSAQVDLGAETLVGISMPAAWDAASLTFQASPDGGTTWQELQGISAVYQVTAAAGQFIALDPAILRGVGSLKIRSGTSGAPVNQTANRTITLITRIVY